MSLYSNGSHGEKRRSPTPPRADPVALFFGPTGPGPFALLALPIADVELEVVVEAMQARLDQLARHPQAATPAADEVRLAIHSAAAQLSDSAARRLLLGLWATDTAHPQSTPPPIPLSTAQLAELERELQIAIGLSGGWNAAAMQRLAIAFQARGANPGDVLQLLNNGDRHSTPFVQTPKRPKRQRARVVVSSKAVEIEKTVFRWDLMLLVAFGVLTAISVIAVIILLTPSKPVPPSLPTSSGSASTSLPMQSPEERRQTRTAPQSSDEFVNDLESGDPRVISSEIVGATQDLPTDAKAAASRFSRAYSAFGKSWPLMKQDEIASIVSAIVDYAFAASRQDVAVVASVTGALQQPRWSDRGGVRTVGADAGVASRLLSERDLPRAFLENLRSEARIAEVSWFAEPALSFRSAVERALPEIAASIALSQPQSVQAWREFVEIRDAVLGDKQSAKDQITINAIDTLMHAKVSSPRDVAPAVQILAASLSWHPGDELRNAIFRWIEDMAVSSELIAEITKAMIASSAPGVDSTMVLPVNAGPDMRSALRERLAQAWQAAAPVPSEVIAAWESTATNVLAQSPTGFVQQLQLARQLSLLSRSAELLQEAKPDEAETVRKETESLQGSSAPQPRPLLAPPIAAPNSPALEFAQAGVSVQGRLEAIKKIQAMGGETDALLARLLVIEASRGSPASVRDAARGELRRRLQSPSVLLATIAFLRLMPETPENAEWVSDLAGRPGGWKNVPKWKTRAELALLNRASEQFPVSADESALDAGADQLAQSWLSRAGESESSSALSPLDSIDRLETTLASVTRSAGSTEPGLSPVEIRRRLGARNSIAPTSLEQVVARQAACVEWTALATIHDRAKNLAGARVILTEWNNARQKATSSTEQLLDGERAMLKLQLLRLSGGGKS